MTAELDNRTLAASRRREATWAAAAFLGLTLPRLLAHELWRDEAWLWLVALDSGSLAELFGPLGRSGQGYLFPVLCWWVAQLTSSPLGLQLLHLVLGTTGAFLFVRWAPLPRLERLLFACGYFPFWEYAVVSRHYVLGVVLLWIALAALRSRSWVLAGAALGLLCQTTVYGFFLAAALAAGVAVAELRRRGATPRATVPPLSRRALAAGAVLAVGGAVMGALQLKPLPGTSFSSGWRLSWDPQHAITVAATPFRGLVPLVRPHLHFWNSSVLEGWPLVHAVAGAVAVAAALWLCLQRRSSWVAFAFGGAAMLAFSYTKLIGASRHVGHWWLLLIAALWLGGGLDGASTGRRWVLRALLLLQIPAALWASVVDLRHPFTNAAPTAALVRDLGLAGAPLLAHREPPAAPLALALGRQLWAPSRGVWARYPDWGPTQREMSDAELRCAARGLAQQQRRDVGLLINRPLPPWAETELLGSRTGAINPSEDYHVYRLVAARLAATAAAAGCPAG
jgi:hypothetical protein